MQIFLITWVLEIVEVKDERRRKQTVGTFFTISIRINKLFSRLNICEFHDALVFPKISERRTHVWLFNVQMFVLGYIYMKKINGIHNLEKVFDCECK